MSSVNGATGAPELTPAHADAELVRLAGRLSDDEIERLAAVADQGDEEVAEREMPDSAGWTQQQRDEIIAGWRAGRRWMAKSAMRPDESGDQWRERLATEHARTLLRRVSVAAVRPGVGTRPRERRDVRRAARRGSTRAGPGSDDPHLEPSPVLPQEDGHERPGHDGRRRLCHAGL